MMSLLACIFIIFYFSGMFVITDSVKDSGNNSKFQIPAMQNRAREIIADLCYEYEEEKISGNLCNRLCYYSYKNNSWTITKLVESNKIVIVLKLSSEEIILKSKNAHIDDFDSPDPSAVEEDFTYSILQTVNRQLGIEWIPFYKRHLINILWLQSDYNLNSLSSADRRSLWSLVSQDEYVTFKLLESSGVSTKIVGSCGHFYQVETLVPFRMKNYYSKLNFKILTHLMGTLKLFEQFLNEPLQLCDVQFDNLALGIDYPQRFMVMDGDMLYTKSRLDHIFTSRRCSVDSDCVFSDCTANCDTRKGFCTERVNTNLEVFCKKFVSTMFGSSVRGHMFIDPCFDSKSSWRARLSTLHRSWAWHLSEV